MRHHKTPPKFAQPLSRRLNRRKFTTAVGAGLLAAPFVRLLRSSPAQAAPGTAKRLAIMITGGTKVSEWKMAGSTADNLVTNSWNDGLDRVKDKCVVVENISGQGGHSSFKALLVTKNFWNGDSVERIVADHLTAEGVPSSIPVLQLAADCTDDKSPFRSGGAVSPVTSPTAALDLVFGDFDPGAAVDAGALAADLAKKRSMLDAVRGDLNELHGMLGVEERPKLDAHLDSLRQYENRLTSDAPSGAGCERPMTMDSDDPVTVAQSHMLLARATLACDISRVVGVSWGQDDKFGINLPEIGVVNDIHNLHHNANVLEDLGKWESYASHQFADFVELMAATPDPESGGTLLDSTLVVWVRHMGDAVSHGGGDCRIVYAGGPSIIRTTPNGAYVDGGGEHYKRGLACISSAMGVTDPEQLGNETPLDGVLA